MTSHTMNRTPLRIVDSASFEPEQLSRSLDAATLQAAEEIVSDVRKGGEPAIRDYARKFGERLDEQPLLIGPEEMERAAKRIDPKDIELLRRVAHRIGNFADSQLECLDELELEIPGGFAGHSIEPIRRVGCYAPAGRFALPSTVLMTTVTALSAGCESIIVATPNPSDLMLATAAVGGATRMLAVGGAHAVAALAYGFDDFERCDLIVGPGNRWVTAAKSLGCHSIRVNAGSQGSYDEQAQRAADGLRQLSEFAAQHDLNVIVENHGGLSSNGAWLAKTINLVDLENCGTLPDFGNFKVSAEENYDRYQGVSELMPYAKAVSAKSHDFDEQGNETQTDYTRMMKIVLDAGYRGWVGIEYEGGKLDEHAGILATKRLLERVRDELQTDYSASADDNVRPPR